MPLLGNAHRKNSVPGTIYNNIHRELAVFQLVTLFYVLSQDTTENRLALSSLHHPFRYLYIFIRSVLTCSYPGWTHAALSACPYRTNVPIASVSSWTFTGLSPACPCLSYTDECRTQHSRCGLTNVVWKGRIISADLLAVICLMQPRMLLTLTNLISFYHKETHLMDKENGWGDWVHPQKIYKQHQARWECWFAWG